MAKYLNESEIGFDPLCVGFPFLGGCMATAVLTQNGIFGFHITPGQAKTKSPLFAEFVQSKALAGGASYLYGSCYWANRYNGVSSNAQRALWEAEMREIATELNYTGPVAGFDTSIRATKITDNETSYIEYHKVVDKAQTFYKRMSKMETQGKVVQGDNDKVQQIFMNRGDHSKFYVGDPFKNKVFDSITVKTTKSNKGLLHQAESSGIHKFTI